MFIKTVCKKKHAQQVHEVLKMIPNIVVLCLLICVTSVSPNSSVAGNMPNEIKKVENTKIHFVPRHNSNQHHYSNMQQSHHNNNTIPENMRKRRHTPFLPGDHWKGLRPDFGPTQTDLEVMVNGTARMKCPITHVSDNRVSISAVINFLPLELKFSFITLNHFCEYFESFLQNIHFLLVNNTKKPFY